MWLACLPLVAVLMMLAPGAAGAISNQECMECHSDPELTRSESSGMRRELALDFQRFKYSVHNVNEVGCTDCHADIEELDFDQDPPHAVETRAVRCFDCHEVEAEAYTNSVHYKAGRKGVMIPCHACHGYHYVTHLEANTVYERENHFCLKCHDPFKFHQWLPQPETHFAHVECTVCHAPDSPRHINLRFYDLVRQEYLEGRDLLKAFNVADEEELFPMLDRDHDGILSVDEFEDMVLLLRTRGHHVTFRGELLSHLKPVIHHVNRGEAKRDCETCHLPTSPFFQEVVISLERDDGTVQRQPVERPVLESYYVSHFYAIGGTRVRWLDRIGLLLPLGGVAVVLLHSTARLVTRGRRPKKTRRVS